MKNILLSIIILIAFAFAGKENPLVISPFFDVSHDAGGENYYYWYAGDYTQYYDGLNLSLGVNFSRRPLYLQLRLDNYLYGILNEGDFFGIAKIGMTEEIIKNGYVDMNFSYTTDFAQYADYSAYSGSVGYYHLLHPIDTLLSAAFSLGVNLGFISNNYKLMNWAGPYNEYWYYETYHTSIFTIAEMAWNTEHLKPYIAFGITRAVDNNYYTIYPKYSGFFSIGLQAQITSILPFHFGNQTKLTYYKKRDVHLYNGTVVRKPNIYIYPESETQIKVSLIPKKGNRVITSIPEYKNDWNISVKPSGIINRKYEFLFYEGKLTDNPKSTIGWSVAGSELWQFLPQKMAEYGFSDKEIKDFVDYWQKHLPKSKFYDIIPLINQEIEKEFTLTIDPKPESVLRVWFYINPTNKKQNFSPPQITEFDRKGFTVVEWGVLLK